MLAEHLTTHESDFPYRRERCGSIARTDSKAFVIEQIRTTPAPAFSGQTMVADLRSNLVEHPLAVVVIPERLLQKSVMRLEPDERVSQPLS